MLFNPTQADVRRFFCGVRSKMKNNAPMEAIETLASLWIARHPEYFAELDDVEAAVQRNYDLEPERTNPFLHLSMHLSISEQCSIDQPRGIRQAVELLAKRRGICTRRTTKPWNAWARCWPTASATAIHPMATSTWPPCSAAPHATEFQACQAPGAAQPLRQRLPLTPSPT